MPADIPVGIVDYMPTSVSEAKSNHSFFYLYNNDLYDCKITNFSLYLKKYWFSISAFKISALTYIFLLFIKIQFLPLILVNIPIFAHDTAYRYKSSMPMHLDHVWCGSQTH